MKSSRSGPKVLLLVIFACSLAGYSQRPAPRPQPATKPVDVPPVRSKASSKRVSAGKPSSQVSSAAALPETPQFPSLTVEQAKVVDLLERSPFIDPQPADALGGQAFMMKAWSLVSPDPDRKNPLDVLRRLEDKIQSVGPVKAAVQSEPGSLSVQYHRITDSTPSFDTTTNSVVSLDPPATYIFTCTGPDGTSKSQTVSCATGCSVMFKF